jgi:Zn-dependent protease with chaperone function
MSLEQTQYEALVQRMEQLAERAPRAYRLRVLALAALGYAYLLILLIALFALAVIATYALRSATLLGAKLLVVVGALLLAVLRSLWVRLAPPEGERLRAADAPEFFELLGQLCSQLAAPRVHEVLITEDFNAAVAQVPRLGVFGWHRNYLLVGLPLMKCLTREQFAAVLAHELGHLSRGHARVANWIYRLRLVWQRLDVGLAARPRWGSGLILSFLRWYVPYFNACSFPLARNNEFEADASSMQLTSPLAAAQALTNTSVISSYLQERYWPAINAGARVSAQPAFAPFSALNASALHGLTPAEAERWLERALNRATSCHDTHPSLRARLAALGMQPQLAPPAPEQAADRLLGIRAASLATAFDSRWRARVAPAWQKVYGDTLRKRDRLTELRERAAAAPLATPQGAELAALEEDVGAGAVRALAVSRELVAREPQSHLARFTLARQLLLLGEAEGIAMMEAVMHFEPEALVPGSQLLRDYWWRHGDAQRAQQWQARAAGRARALEQIRKQRQRVHVHDTWLEHALPAEALQALVAGLQGIRGLRAAWLVRKQVEHWPDKPLYVLGVELRTRGRPGRQALAELRRTLVFPGETVIMQVAADNGAFARKFRAAGNARLL